MDWISFWDGSHAIYVSDRHKQLHYARIAADLARLVPTPDARVLDYGCGEALAAATLAKACGSLTLCDAAPGVRDKLRHRFSQDGAIRVAAPDDVAALPDRSFDLIVANSLLQYLTRPQLDELLSLWRRLLAPGGRLLLADIIPPDRGAARDAAALLAFAARDGFLGAALLGLARTAVSPYRKLRGELGLSTYREADFLALLRQAGFEAERTRPNVGHNQGRMAFLAVPA
ncbi:class I SAM-dependent methyltransferase [Aquabacter spiritensis]|uniref:Ubiquinone/menaquinone biosynthesis C-methylase UbiE n=1 Tax=Aquabacter spiritensis TaxID=933073 RepID=A0A4R3LWW6_9HYPH|nr:class I SAM-dependent methyltransferase [Aquabacter spiritensis]TCT04656.1 ubiquinone/menaquinone biosynthesis C-methylase UbiE [Aquabacter spiritensis]